MIEIAAEEITGTYENTTHASEVSEGRDLQIYYWQFFLDAWVAKGELRT